MTSGGRKRLWFVAAALGLAVASGYAWLRYAPRSTPAGQPALVEIGQGNFATLADAFDAAADRTRVVALLSPS